MDRKEEFDCFIESLIERHQEEYRKTCEYEYRQKCKEKTEEMIETGFTEYDRIFVENILLEFYCYADREAELLYKQGMKDGIWLLKNLGVFA